jgi:guanylate kinase
VPHQSVEDDGRALRPAASRARRPLAALTSRPKLFVVTGPSGAGKGTLIAKLLERRPDLEVAVSATTRPRRPGEVEGVHYYFLSDDEFDERNLAGEFLEYVTFLPGHRSGTLRSELDRILARGHVCILELEPQGALAVRDLVPGSVTIFVNAPLAELGRRLRERATESAGEIDERLRLARAQQELAGEFQYVVANDDLERAVDELEGIVTREAASAGKLSAT